MRAILFILTIIAVLGSFPANAREKIIDSNAMNEGRLERMESETHFQARRQQSRSKETSLKASETLPPGQYNSELERERILEDTRTVPQE